jgi:c-di-GMP-binding flagellar brake protein YcgR
MSEAARIDSSTTQEALAEACQRNQSLDLIRLLERGPDACRSRFIELGRRHVAVELPSRRGVPIPVRPGEEVEVYFRLGPHRYYFKAQVESRSVFRSAGGLSLPILMLRRPRHLELRQRRRHHRVSLGPASRLMAQLWPMPKAGAEARPEAIKAMEVRDLSAGGLSLLFPHGEGCPVEEGETLILLLPLEAGQPPLKVGGAVLRVSRILEGAIHVAVEFTDLDQSPEGKSAAAAIERFVADREREELRRARA